MGNNMFINTAPFNEAGLVIQVHIIAAIVALFLGAIVLWRKKGGQAHRLMGRIWVASMVVVAVGSFFINELKVWGNYSPIHLLSVATLISLVLAIVYVRKGMIRAHRQTMQSLYIGAMLVAGGLAFMPGRIMYRIVVEPFVEAGQVTSISASWQIPIVAVIVVGASYYAWDWFKSRAR